MSKVTVHAGLTFQIGPMSSNQYARVDVTLADLDPEQPLEEQIAGGKKVAASAFKVILEELDRQSGAIAGKGKW